MFPLYAPRIFEIAVRASVVQSLFSKLTETSAFCESLKNHVHGMFQKETLLEISKSPLLIGFAGLKFATLNQIS